MELVMCALGYSCGAGTLIKYFGEQADHCRLTAAISLCASYDYIATTNGLEKWFNLRLYNKALTETLLGYLRTHEGQFKDTTYLNLTNVYRARTIREYDIATIVPLFGYADVLDYYKEGSSGPWIQHVRIPSLISSTIDDPICVIEGLPLLAVRKNEHVIAVLTKEGGHVGWLEGWWPRKYT
ncbi:unnamed protein product [Didymodactylos carnosus]|uniref:Uncharacterized protein n=1 Tax=Didymodactylos carnosus TaxID=1234261 RepID=A0A813YTJ4_9BILA|nr:unnamed protein product [Didymodactylos carnosus]CAF0912813.1 unnamed protein product [Didymodactylos carnosus]CAF3673653.1 unnamed protein product [Didymodactylos carnosus]CAF3691615.1 unnamed protein product [Didymodactylos carnosus]